MDKITIAEIEAALGAATPGEWSIARGHDEEDHDHILNEDGDKIATVGDYGALLAGECPSPADAFLVANAPHWLRHLLAALREREAALRKIDGDLARLQAELDEEREIATGACACRFRQTTDGVDSQTEQITRCGLHVAMERERTALKARCEELERAHDWDTAAHAENQARIRTLEAALRPFVRDGDNAARIRTVSGVTMRGTVVTDDAYTAARAALEPE